MNSIISSVSSQITNNIFSKIDSKNQGYISKSDLTDALGKVNADDQNVDSETFFQSMDADSDGKITKSEMSSKIENLLGQLTNNMQGTNGRPIGPPHGMRPPEGMGSDSAGVTKDQATEIASSSQDDLMSSLMSEISENFDAADSNQDGKVSRAEGKAFHEANQSQNNASSIDSSTKQGYELQMRMAQLIEAYGLGNSEESSSIFANA